MYWSDSSFFLFLSSPVPWSYCIFILLPLTIDSILLLQLSLWNFPSEDFLYGCWQIILIAPHLFCSVNENYSYMLNSFIIYSIGILSRALGLFFEESLFFIHSLRVQDLQFPDFIMFIFAMLFCKVKTLLMLK